MTARNAGELALALQSARGSVAAVSTQRSYVVSQGLDPTFGLNANPELRTGRIGGAPWRPATGGQGDTVLIVRPKMIGLLLYAALGAKAVSGYADYIASLGPDGYWRLGEANPYRAAVLATNPDGYWRLGEASGAVAADVMGLYPGTYVNAPTLGVAGALAGDGDTAVTLTSALNTAVALPYRDWGQGSNQVTIAAWIKPSDATVRQTIWGNETLSKPMFQISGGGVRTLDVLISGLWIVNSAASVITTGVWQHVAYTRSGPGAGTHALYVDGVSVALVSPGPTNYDFTAGASTPHIGRRASGVQVFGGGEDEVAYWNRALSAAEIAALYAARIPPVAAAAVVGAAGTYVGGPTLGVAGLIAGDTDKAVTLNGTTQHANLTASVSLRPGDVMSLSIWFKRSTITGVAQALISAGWGDYILRFNADDKILFGVLAVANIFVSTAAYNDTTSLHHLVITKNGATFAAYLDGVMIAGTFTNYTLVSAAGQPVLVGASNDFNGSIFTPAQFFAGTIDEPAIWDRALTPAEIAAAYALGTSGPRTHTFTPAASLPWLTVWRHFGEISDVRLMDARVTKLVISSRSGFPVTVQVSLAAAAAAYRTAKETTAAVETTDHFLHYHGAAALLVEGVAFSSISDWTLTIETGVALEQSLAGPMPRLTGLAKITMTIAHVITDAALWNRMIFGSASPSNLAPPGTVPLTLAGSPVGVQFTLTAATAPERSLRIALPQVALGPMEGFAPVVGSGPINVRTTLVAYAPAAGSAITAILKNGQSVY